MKKSKYSEQQIISLLKEVELGAKVADVFRKYGMSEATYYKWKIPLRGHGCFPTWTTARASSRER